MKLLIDSSYWFFRYGTRHCSVGAQNWQGSLYNASERTLLIIRILSILYSLLQRKIIELFSTENTIYQTHDTFRLMSKITQFRLAEQRYF